VSSLVRRPRLGLIVPSTNLTIERVVHRLSFSELFGVDIVVTRLKVATIASTSDSKRQFHPRRLRAAARLLADARPDVIAWTGTSSFWLGVDEESQWMRETGNELGIGITSATEAVMKILRDRQEISRISLFTPYERAIHESVIETLQGANLRVSHDRNLGMSDNSAFAAIAQETIEREIRSFPDRDPIVVVCTGICACIPGIDIVDSLIAVLWLAMVRAGADGGGQGRSLNYPSVYAAMAARTEQGSRAAVEHRQ
jgi:maleate isomerase